jgi:hypothetical protein
MAAAATTSAAFNSLGAPPCVGFNSLSLIIKEID